MKRYVSVLVLASALGANSPVAKGASLSFDASQLSVQAAGKSVQYSGLEQLVVAPSVSLPAEHLFIPLNPGETAAQVLYQSHDSVELPSSILPAELWDIPTSLDPTYRPLGGRLSEADRLGSSAVRILGERTEGPNRYAEIMLFPVTIDSLGRQWLHREISIDIVGRTTGTAQLLPAGSISVRSGVSSTLESGTGEGLDYIIITGAALVPSFQRLVCYKQECGYHAGVVVVDSILSQSAGSDAPEKLRNYLKGFYAAGGKYVLLGGDETIVPIRYAYHLTADSMPSLGDMQVCDLYYADLTGDWDRDHDGVYGERIQDAADLTPELMVGRLPFRTSDQVDRYIDKLILYETNPGNGDQSYLTRTFFFSADQMRDYLPATQHARIASAFPAPFQVDTTEGVEAARGDDPAPVNLSPRALRPVLNSGFGIINIIAHGRDDGFAVRTSGYNNNPKLYLISNPPGGESDCFDSVQAPDKPAFYYSLACNNGAIDYDQPPFNSQGICFATNVLSEKSGAVGFIGYSRWGWVGTSYLLQEAYFDSLFAHPDQPAVAALYESKLAFSYYRDLAYGLNYFGDPTLRVYCAAPATLAIRTTSTLTGVDFAVSSSDGNPSGCRVILSADGQMIAQAVAGPDGKGHFELTNTLNSWVITATKPGAMIKQINYSGSIVTGVDDRTGTPKGFALGQNYPNPFNPSTRIRFSLPERAGIRLSIFNLLGREVKVLIDESMSAGDHEIEWDGRDRFGAPAASGVYFYRLVAGRNQETRRMVLLK